MPLFLFWFFRSFLSLTVLALGTHVTAPPAFSGLFTLEQINCGKDKVKLQALEGLGNTGFLIALPTEGHTISVGTVPSSGETNFDLLVSLCEAMAGQLSSPASTTSKATVSPNVQSFTVGNWPVDTTSGDFNGDGHADLAVANQDSDNVSILLNNAGDEFLAPTGFPTGSEPKAIVSGDFNKDGNIDLVTANLGDGMGNMSLLQGNGSGDFSAPVPIPFGSFSGSLTAAAFGSSPGSLTAADFDKDNNLDLAVADSAGNAMVLKGNGDGTFQAATVLNAPGPLSILAEDINGDEAIDIITNGMVLLNDGAGNFPTATGYASDFQPTIVRAGDLNNDGILDLVTANESFNTVTALMGKGNGSFQTPLHYIVGNSPREIIIKDVDGNGAKDLVVSNLGTDHLSVLLGTGDGGFTGSQAFPSTAHASQTTSRVALADFDGDGLLDLAATNLLSGSDAVVLKGQAFGKFAVPLNIIGQDGGGVVAGDFNEDTKQDIVFIQQGSPGTTNDSLEVRLGNGNLTFGSPSTITLPDADYALNFTLAMDVDANGILDLVTANTGTDNVSVFLGNGNGTFQGGLTTTVGDQPTWLAAGHLDGNAILDLAVVNAGPLGGQAGTLSVLFGTGNGNFSPGPEFFLNTEPNSVVIGDFNGDGQSDLAAIVQAPLFNWNLQIILGNGNGTFEPPTLLAFSEKLVGNLTTSDLDLDGDLDLIMTVGSSEIGILQNNGNGTFQPLVLFDGGTPIGPIMAIDINHDQRPDLVVPQIRSGTTAVMLNTAAAPTMVSHDLNGNGTADIVWHNTGTGAVAFWLLNGPTISSAGFPGGMSVEWQIVDIGDVNADGKADVIWHNSTSGVVAVWLMNGLTISSTGFPGTAPIGWVLAGTGDLNGNGTADLVWRNTNTGEVIVWLLDGTTIASTRVPGQVSLEWQIADIGDVNGDGKADIIWCNSTSGVVAVWLMNGLTIGSTGFPGTAPIGWVLAGTGDLNGNGTTDIVWRNTSTGGVILWLLNGGTMAAAGFPDGVSLEWKIAQVGDVNADGKADVIWRNSTSGVVAVWLMNGLTINSVGFPGTAPTEWEIQ